MRERVNAEKERAAWREAGKGSSERKAAIRKALDQPLIEPNVGERLIAAQALDDLLAELAAARKENGRLAVEAATADQDWKKALQREEKLREALRFYAEPMTYFGIAFFPDSPCGEFADDVSEVPWPDGGTNHKPGARARAALSEGEG